MTRNTANVSFYCRDIKKNKDIPLQTWIPYIQGRFAAYGKQIDKRYIEQICETVEYQASYVQQLSYSVFLLSEEKVTDDSFELAVEDLLAQNSNVFIEQTQSLTEYQLNFLRAVIDGIKCGFGGRKSGTNTILAPLRT